MDGPNRVLGVVLQQTWQQSLIQVHAIVISLRYPMILSDICDGEAKMNICFMAQLLEASTRNNQSSPQARLPTGLLAGWAGLGWAGLGWAGLAWVGLGWLFLDG